MVGLFVKCRSSLAGASVLENVLVVQACCHGRTRTVIPRLGGWLRGGRGKRIDGGTDREAAHAGEVDRRVCGDIWARTTQGLPPVSADEKV